jgi:hypothetical protein
MLRTLVKTGLATGAMALVVCASALALSFELSGTAISVTAAVTPRTLPAHGGAPVEVESITRIKAPAGSTATPLKEIVFAFDKHGSIDTKGLPVCTAAKLAGATPAVARKRCAGAIVGEGLGRARVEMPGSAATTISSPLTFFNAPSQGGRPQLLVHAYETIPSPQAVLVPLTIERIQQGRYGYRVRIPIPEIAGGFGAATLAEATIGKTWKRGGKTVGYANASCSEGRLQVHGVVSLADGSFFPGTLVSPCHVGE